MMFRYVCAGVSIRQLHAYDRDLREELWRRQGAHTLRNALECDACLLFFDQMDAEMKTNLLAAYVSAGMPEKVLAFVSQVRRFVRVDLTRISPVEAVGEQSDV